MSNRPHVSKAPFIHDVMNFVAGIYFCTVLVGVLVMLISFGLGLLPNAALRIALGILSGHAVLVVWSKYKGKPATWIPLLGAVGAFILLAMAFGVVAKVHEVGTVADNTSFASSYFDLTKALFAYGMPVLLPLIGVGRTLVELDPKS